MNLFECTTVEQLEDAISKGADLEQIGPPWDFDLGPANPWYVAVFQGLQTPLAMFSMIEKREMQGHIVCLLKHGAKVDFMAIRRMVERGYTDAIKLCNPLEINFRKALSSACRNGHCDIVDYFLSISGSSETVSNSTSEYVCRTNKIDLFDLFIKHQVPLKPNMIISACKGGSIDILNRLYLHCPNFHSYITTNIEQCYGHNTKTDQWLQDNGFPH